MTDRYSIVGCRECSEFWIVEDLRWKETVTCPRCETRRKTKLLRSIESHDDLDVLRELRSRYLADRAGELEASMEVDDYGVLKEEVDEYLRQYDDVFAERVDEYLQRYYDVFAERIDFESLERRRERFAEEAEAYLDREKSALDETIDRRRIRRRSFFEHSVQASIEADRSDREIGDLPDGGGSIDIGVDAPIDVDVMIDDLGEWSISKIHRALFTQGDLGEKLTAAVIELAEGRTRAEVLEVLQEAGVDALDGLFATLCLGAARDRDRVPTFLETTEQLGTGQTHQNLRSPREDIFRGAVAIFAASGVTPRIGIHLGEAFREARRDHREDVLGLIRALGHGCQVHLVTDRVGLRFLYYNHREQVPSSVEEQCNPHSHSGRIGSEETEALVRAAREALDPDGPQVRILRLLEAEPAETLTYTRLEGELRRDRSTIRYHVTQHLQELELVDRLKQVGKEAVSLTHVGKALLVSIDREIGRQKPLSEVVGSGVDRTGKVSDNAVYSAREHDPPTGTVGADRGLIQTEWMSRWEHIAVAGTAEQADITLVDEEIVKFEDCRDRRVSFDPDRGELVVAAQYMNPMQYTVSIALALGGFKVLREVLDEDVLEEIFEEYPLAILRDCRNLGYLKSEDANGEDYRDRLLEEAEHIRELTRKHHREAYDDRDRFRGEITRAALGFATTMVHLLDLADVDVILEVRLPEFSRDYDAQRRRDIVTSITKAVTRQSKYGEFLAHRQLYEDREDRREAAMAPEVDASDPIGELVDSFVLVGPGVDALEGELRTRLRNPEELHEDAPEFGISVDVASIESGSERTAYAAAATRSCRAKNLSTTPKATAMLRAFTGSPYAVAEAIGRGLQTEELHRRIYLDEVRRALASLGPKQILPDARPTLSRMVHALLGADRPLSQTELADRADISTRSVRNHAEVLEAFDFVRKTPDGYRFALPFRSERYREVFPEWIGENMTTLQDIMWRIVEVVAPIGPDTGSDPPPAYQALEWPPDLGQLVEVWPWVDPWIEVVDGLLDVNREAHWKREPQTETTREITFGAELLQNRSINPLIYQLRQGSDSLVSCAGSSNQR